MKKTQSWLPTILILGLLACVTQQYALEGIWTLTNHRDIKLDPAIDV
jgi:hypothetical protein